MSTLLDRINKPNDIQSIPEEQLPRLCKEIRRHIIKAVSKNGGHLASNLGTVELTVALHRFLHFPEDKLIFDVGHQCYTHKILTGRKEELLSLRTEGGISGFPKRKESNCDVIDSGHSSTSVSIASGLAMARDLKGEDTRIVAVIGDGSLSGGPAYEALNNAGRFKTNLIIILNDNAMSISPNVGGMANYLRTVRMSAKYIDFKGNVEQALNRTAVGAKLAKKLQKMKAAVRSIVVPGEFFTEMGLTYYGPVDGHNIAEIERALQAAEKIDGSVIIHAITHKGKGYRFAEQEPSRFHGIPPFDPGNGRPFKNVRKENYTDIFRDEIVKIAQKDPSVLAVTAAMSDGTGLDLFQNLFPNRFFDVGIAEGHAASFAAGLSLDGMHPVLAVYSTFLQRAYDEIMEDICLNDRPVTLALDRAGIVGADGETHQGVFDIAYLSHMPNMTLMAPRNGAELRKMLAFAVSLPHPAAVRYPRGRKDAELLPGCAEIEYGKAEVLQEGSEIAVMFFGTLASEAMEIAEHFRKKGLTITVINARFAKPFDRELIRRISESHKLLLTMEEGVKAGGFGEHVSSFVMEEELPVKVMIGALDDVFIPHGNDRELRKKFGLSCEEMIRRIEQFRERHKS